jgi:DNA-binding winged helix-turn-helix (wHTH) protein/tetratricopeptide (TPR) repeat protein
MKVFQPFRLDTVNHCLWRAEERMSLTPKAFDVLRYLVEHAGRLVTQDEILEALWPETYVNPEGIRKYIREIRKVLDDEANRPLFIETLPKRGYQFVAKVTDELTLPSVQAESETARNMVGRDTLLSELNRHFEKALTGQRQVVLISGEAGMGKTTLVDVFQQGAVRAPGLRIARGQCIEGFGGKEPYYPMLDALGSLLNHAENGPWIQTLAKQAPTWLAQFPALLKPEQKAALQQEILGSTRERMVRELCEALEAMAAQGPLIVILEDLHWVDPSTLDIISAIARRREPAKLLLIGTYRPVEVVLTQSPLKGLKQDLMVRHLCHEINMERLGESDVTVYLAKEFPESGFPAGLANLIHRNSGGNALFMVAIVRDMVNKGLIALDRGRWILTAPVQEIYPGIPDTLQHMLEIQIEQLTGEEQRILQGCSVAGERFSAWAAAVMLDMHPASIEDVCDKLSQRQQFIRFVGIEEAPNGADSVIYEFRHSLYRQALYRQMSSPNRSKLHRSLGDALTAALPAGSRELAAEIALHLEEGRDYEHATVCLMLTAENAVQRFAHGDAIQVLQHALELTSLLPPDDRTELEIQIFQRIGELHYVLGAMSDSASAYETAAARAAEAGRVTGQIDALSRLAFPAWYLNPERGNAVCEQAIQVSERHGDPLLLARMQLAASYFRLFYDNWSKEDEELCGSAHRRIRSLSSSAVLEDVLYAYVQTIQADYGEASKQAEAGIRSNASPAARLLALGAKSLTLVARGRFGDLLRMVRTGRALAEKNGEDPWSFILREAWLHAICFDFDGVLRVSNLLMRADAEQHAGEARTMAMVATGLAELGRGRPAEALPYFEQVRDPSITPRFFLHWHWRNHARRGVAEAHLVSGDLVKARIAADLFLEAALSISEPNMHVLAWDTNARVAWAENNLGKARDSIENALRTLDKFDIPVWAWRVHSTAWDLYLAEGENEKAEGHRERAQGLVMRLADSFEHAELLRSSFLSAAPVRRIFRQAVSA